MCNKQVYYLVEATAAVLKMSLRFMLVWETVYVFVF